jgi:hypothetical protein
VIASAAHGADRQRRARFRAVAARHAGVRRFLKTASSTARSLAALRTHRGWVPRLLTRTFTPDALIEALADVCTDPVLNVGGFHLYTFNELERTQRWRRETIERLASED